MIMIRKITPTRPMPPIIPPLITSIVRLAADDTHGVLGPQNR
jgi:hypothetical protein